MKIIQLSYDEKNPISGLSLCLGFFDGMHRAHQKLFDLTIINAKKLNVSSGIMTFSTHILSFLKQEHFRALSTVEDKIQMAEKLGFDYFFILVVSKNLLSMPAVQFVNRYLLDAAHVVVGYDYTFGYKGEGTPELLEQLLPRKISIIPCLNFYGKKVGSTRIRSLLEAGKIPLANRLLNRPYQIQGYVVSGHGRGRQLGYPTANLSVDGYFIPKEGVYYTKALINQKLVDSMTSIGTNPSFSEDDLKVETHLLDYSDRLYGQDITILFYEYLRKIKRFSSGSELVDQLHQDEDNIRKISWSKEE
ncbi:MAG: bifunctional riboflavin kinase/FAD synthetase [Candidatus Izemoplasmatales bacterium]|nr:bifunctional riboflavin kinase/FAD synthetase [Candidatus Izemoplasmatales bacterium]